jgi:hypothetical protein
MLSLEQSEVLSRVEQSELSSLSWGRIDSALTEEELHAMAEEVVGDADRARAVIDELLDLHLLVDMGGVQMLVRSRFSESVRLLVRNRQLLFGRPWQDAPQLVNDFRVLARPRVFPRRDIPFPQVVQIFEQTHGPLHEATRTALRAMLEHGDGFLELAQFQADAARRIWFEIHARRTSATIISAGTGSGKTKAFYLPVLAYLAAEDDNNRWARVIAIYPRNELLKDQLTEALAQADLIAASGNRTLSVGALFGPTPHSVRYILDRRDGDMPGWRRVTKGFACRYIRCPHGCGEDLVWLDADLEANREVLVCVACGWKARAGQIVLSRESLATATPHVLFTTTEMLNRSLADARLRPIIIGSGPVHRPQVLLLDEMHTYGGVHGAQVALLLRRWRHALGRTAPLHVVGLSATLEGPSAFMKMLTGIDDVEEIAPASDQIDLEGSEYALVLRGNPVSGTALLSTTIQTSMLGARLLESRVLRQRTGTSGSRMFAFTDNLDVTNRLYWDLANAEGVRRPRGSLAQLRNPAAADGDLNERDRDGQIWQLPLDLGWALDAADRLRVRRTSSQDAGVDPDSDVIVATSSLELGFDDPEVGSVVQHKAPRDDAAFIQRKGRSGRVREMRPWTIVVLSDYGRDRTRYQAYETLFAPILRPRDLPIDNVHVLKMQAAYCVLDWLCTKVPNLRSRADLARRREGDDTFLGKVQARAADALLGLLTDSRQEREFERYVRQAMDLSPEQTAAVMWHSPRALMTSVIPTLLRRLETNWTTAGGVHDRLIADAPLPEFAPRALFSDLNLPEVEIRAPAPRPHQDPHVERMSIVQALSELVPGRASRRFGVESYAAWHWVPLPEAGDDGRIRADVDAWVAMGTEDGTVDIPNEALPRPVIRPWAIELQLATRDEQSANARPVWVARLEPTGPGWSVAPPPGSSLEALIAEMAFYTHALGNEVRTVRAISQILAAGENGAERPVEIGQLRQDQWVPVAVGFTADVDAIRLRLNDSDLPQFANLSENAQAGVRTGWFEAALVTDENLRSRLSPFTIAWLSDLYLAALAAVALTHDIDALAGAVDRVKELGIARSIDRALSAVFVASDVEDDGEPRGLTRLREALHDDAVTDRIAAHAAELSKASDKTFDAHVREVTISSVAAAAREACQRMAPTLDSESLVIDVVPSHNYVDIWLSEPEAGSGGTVEELRRLVTEDPRRFGRLLNASLGATDHEIVDWTIRSVLELQREDPDLHEAMSGVREAIGAGEALEAQRVLRASLRTRGIPADHGVLSTLNLRVLRPGSSPETDQALEGALAAWDRVETALGIEVNARAVAYSASREGVLDMEQIYSLLWPRGREARAAGLSSYSRFGTFSRPDRLILDDRRGGHVKSIRAGSAVIVESQQRLREHGIVRIETEVTQARALQNAVSTLLTDPIEVGSVVGFPRVVSAERSNRDLAITLELPEAGG